MLTALHQWVPSFATRDAIGSHALKIREVLHARGLESEVFVVDARGEARSASRHYRKMPIDRSGRVGILYHLSVGSEMAEVLRVRPEPLVVDYHNITPASFFDGWEPGASYSVALGRRQLPELASRATVAMADSAFNAGELADAGYRDPQVVPILLDTGTFDRAIDGAHLGRLRAEPGQRWLFVGRLAPNKCQHDVVSAFAAHRRLNDPEARLDLVGGVSSHAYEAALQEQIRALGLDDAVTLTGSVSDGQLAAHYAAADVFVCLSEHEGFCVPLLEAMHHRVPVVAFASTAVPETLGDGGLLLRDKSPVTVAMAVDRVLTDAPVAEALREGGDARLAEMTLDAARERLLAALAPVLPGGAA